MNYVDCSIKQHREILNLRNHPDVYIWMTHSQQIDWISHLNFVGSLINDTKRKYFAVFKDGELAGSFNFTKVNGQTWERGLITNPRYQGTGLTIECGNLILSQLPTSLFQVITAKVMKNNIRSIHYHEKVGYKEVAKDIDYIYYKLIL